MRRNCSTFKELIVAIVEAGVEMKNREVSWENKTHFCFLFHMINYARDLNVVLTKVT